MGARRDLAAVLRAIADRVEPRRGRVALDFGAALASMDDEWRVRFGFKPLGIMGQAGPEAIMPLKRDRKGRLGGRDYGAAVSAAIDGGALDAVMADHWGLVPVEDQVPEEASRYPSRLGLLGRPARYIASWWRRARRLLP